MDAQLRRSSICRRRLPHRRPRGATPRGSRGRSPPSTPRSTTRRKARRRRQGPARRRPQGPARARKRTSRTTRCKRQKYEGQLYQVKTNKEYSAVLIEIEEVKQEKSRSRRRSSTSWSAQERLAGEHQGRGGALQAAREPRASSRGGHRSWSKLRRVEAELAGVKSERARAGSPAAQPHVLADYDRHPARPRRPRRRAGDQAELLRRPAA